MLDSDVFSFVILIARPVNRTVQTSTQEHRQQMPLVQPKISMKKEQDNLIKNKTKQNKNLNRIKFRIIELHLSIEYNRAIEYNRGLNLNLNLKKSPRIQ